MPTMLSISGPCRAATDAHQARPAERGAREADGPGKRGTRPYFAVDDIKAGAARVNELGGEANEPMPVPDMGWFSACKDPHGNELGLWQTGTSAPPPAQ
jgi:predicted enzyme related to lactoylglutathione lyase